MSSLTNKTAQSAEQPADQSGQRIEIFLHSFAFVFGFGVVFTLLGSAAGLLGASLLQYQIILQKVGGILLVVFGLATLGLFFQISEFITKRDLQGWLSAAVVRVCHFFNALLYTERRVKQMHEINPGWGYASSFAVGVSFSAGWVPCIGPILASILLLASNSATAKQGAALLAFYSLGLGIPFLITGLAFGRMTKLLRKMNRYLKIISIVSGLFMIMMGYILWTDQITVLITQFGYLNEIVFVVEEWVTGSLGNIGIRASNVDSTSAIPLAIFAGVISFISPCVLPLVPAYIGYLGGATLNK